MSAKIAPKTNPKRGVRAVPVPVPTPAKEVPAPVVVEPVPAAVEPVATPVEVVPAVEPAEPAAPKPAGIIGARIHKVLADNGMNALVSRRLGELKPGVKEYDAAVEALKSGKIKVATEEDAKKRVERDITEEERAAFTATVERLKDGYEKSVETVASLGSCKFRFAAEVDDALAEICDWMVKDLALHAKKSAKEAKSQMATVESLYAPGLESLDSFGLISGTALYRETHRTLRSRQSTEQHQTALNRALVEKERELKKKWREAGLLNRQPRKKAADVAAAPAEAAAEAPAAAEEPAEVVKPDVPVSTKHFGHYVQGLMDQAGDKADFPKGFRKAAALVQHLSELTSQFIGRVVVQLNLIMALDGTKTITLDHILCVVKGFLVDGLAPTSSLSEHATQVPEKAALKAELAKKKAAAAAGEKYVINYDELPKVAGTSFKLSVGFTSSGSETVTEICNRHRRAAKKQ